MTHKTLIPTHTTFRANGRTRRFLFPENRKPAGKVSVFHHRGGRPRFPPQRITKKTIIFPMPPQKGDRIDVVYDYLGG